MTRAKISEYSATANDNTDVNGINIAEGCPPSSMNNMGREIMAALKRFQVGSDGDGVTVGGSLVVSGSTTANTLSATVFQIDTISEKTSAAGVTVDGVLLKDSQVSTDQINEKTSATGVTVDGVLLKDSEVTTDVIKEKTSATGVTVDSVLLKDGMVVTDSSMNFRNRIINGDMRIDQRNAGASVSTSNGAYYLDRWLSLNNGTGFTSTAQQSTTVPANFTNSFVLTTSTTKTPASGEGFVITQKIEGYNTADFGFGTANAKTITLSFYVRSSKTGTYSVCFVNSAFDRSYVAEYTIASANTWEQKSITLTGDTSGTWNTTTSMGVGVYFSVSNGDGSNTTSTIGSWQAGNFYLGSQNQVNLFDASGATFYITGVQLEVGSVATPFERRPYGQELSLCQRYFEKSGPESLFSGNVTSGGDYYNFVYYKVTKRAAATVTPTNSIALSFPTSASSVNSNGIEGFQLYRTANASARGYFFDSWTASSEL